MTLSIVSYSIHSSKLQITTAYVNMLHIIWNIIWSEFSTIMRLIARLAVLVSFNLLPFRPWLLIACTKEIDEYT